jgi:NAD(P)-dependent dehydrogenase (short-subunit alcohol dehydrogenase family)
MPERMVHHDLMHVLNGYDTDPPGECELAAFYAAFADGDAFVTDAGSIRQAAAQLESETGALDVLVNNAGIAVADGEGLPGTGLLQTIERIFDVNFYGALRVTQAFLPLVRKAKAGRIVNVSSTMGSIATLQYPDSPIAQFPAFAYASSKTALNALTAWLAVELKATAIKVSSVCPGFNATDINDNRGTQHPSEGAKVVVRAATLGADEPSGAFLDVNGTVGW